MDNLLFGGESGARMSSSPLCFDPFVIGNIEGASFLDIGCGYGKWGYLIKKYLWDKERSPSVVGMDIFEPHLHNNLTRYIYDSVVLGNACSLPFKDNSFDCIIACEVMEHLEPQNGKSFVDELKRVARKCFVITTPNFSCLRGGGDTSDGFNEYEHHLSNLSYKEFSALGLTQVIGVGSLKSQFWRINTSLASLGFYFPVLSRYLMGFWFSDGLKRELYVE